MKTQKASAPSLTPHQKSLLLLSVAQFLQRNSFSITLNNFLSEASIQKDDLTGSSLDLEEMCCKYLAISDIPVEDKTSKSKKKKKTDDSKDVEKEKCNDDENRTSKVDSTSTDDKGSKKRKRLDSEAHDSQPVNEHATEYSKRRKTEATEEQLNSLAGGDKQLHEQAEFESKLAETSKQLSQSMTGEGGSSSGDMSRAPHLSGRTDPPSVAAHVESQQEVDSSKMRLEAMTATLAALEARLVELEAAQKRATGGVP